LQRMYTCLNKTRPLVRLLGPLLGEDPGFDLEALLNRNIVFEFDGLTNEYQEFLINILLFRVFLYRIDNGQRGPLRHALIFDEAKMVYAQDRAKPSSHITRLTSMAREFGEALVVSDQMPSSLGEAIKANVFTTVSLNLSSMKDIQAMTYGMALTAEQRERLMALPIGTAVARYADRYTKPFLLQVPHVPIVKDVSDTEVEQHMAPVISSLRKEPRAGSSPASFRDSGSETSSLQPKVLLLGTADDPEIPSHAWSLLQDIREHPYLTTTERYQKLGLSARQGGKIGNMLTKQGFVTKVTIPAGRTGRPGLFFELTEKGVQRVGRQKLGAGKGGFIHRFYQDRIKKHFENLGYIARIEAYQNGKSVDVGVWKITETVAVEVAMTAAHELENIEKDFQAGWDRVVVACFNNSVRQKVEKEVRQSPAYNPLIDRIEFIPVRNLTD
jgi:hypothetical protein